MLKVARYFSVMENVKSIVQRHHIPIVYNLFFAHRLSCGSLQLKVLGQIQLQPLFLQGRNLLYASDKRLHMSQM
jgi:hypothetical protein